MSKKLLKTELWATVLLNIGLVATTLSSSGTLPSKWAAVLSTASVVAYTLGRSLAKTGQDASSDAPKQVVVTTATPPVVH